MKRIIASFTLILLSATIVSPVKAWSWHNGWNQVTKSGSVYASLAGLAAAGAGIHYFMKNGSKAKESQIAFDLRTLESVSSRVGLPANRTASIVERDSVTSTPFREGLERIRTSTTTVTDPTQEAQRNRVCTRNTLARLKVNLTEQEFARLAKAKHAYDQVVAQQNQNVIDEGDALGNLQRVIQELRSAYPTHEGQDALAGFGITFGILGFLFGAIDFYDGAAHSQ